MLQRGNVRLFTGLLSIGLTAVAAAQSFDLSWNTIDGGGGYGFGGGFVLEGTIGQPDAGMVMTGGGYTLAGGFWAGGWRFRAACASQVNKRRRRLPDWRRTTLARAAANSRRGGGEPVSGCRVHRESSNRSRRDYGVYGSDEWCKLIFRSPSPPRTYPNEYSTFVSDPSGPVKK